MHEVLLGFKLFALLVVLATAATYVTRAVQQRRAGPAPQADRLGLLHAGFSFAAECAAFATVLLFLAIGRITNRCSARAQRGPLILVHGFGGNRGCWWLLRRRLTHAGWGPVCTFDYRSVRLDIEAAARELRQFVDTTAATVPDKPVTLIGYGIGGLVTRLFARRYTAPRVRRIVTLGTPHFGTELARWVPALSDFAPDSKVIHGLNAGDRLPQQFDFIAIQSSFDATVQPASSAHYPLAFNIQVNDVGHFALLLSRKVYRLIAENLEAPVG
ncbi:MAG: alpha/beta fold hydrolase [Deltaproteobacteria bacterium]|nr:alpha/beta fold hydrolase [Deltaproteobacteria bacterium]